MALCILAAVAASLILPPIENLQIANALNELRQPVIEVVVAIAFLVAIALPMKALASILVAVLLFTGTQLGLWVHTTTPGRSTRDEVATWTTLPTLPSSAGTVKNHPDAIGSATYAWHNGSVNFNLNGNVGTSTQGLYLLDSKAPPVKYYWSARVTNVQATPSAACPLMFGIKDNRSYYMFYVAEQSPGKFVAKVVQRYPTANGYGFTGQDFRETDPLPYIEYWNVIDRWEADAYELGIRADGDHYRFFVDDRQVYETDLPNSPPHQVALGVLAVTNTSAPNVTCHFSHLILRSS